MILTNLHSLKSSLLTCQMALIPKGGKIPLFGKEGQGEILWNMSIQF